MLSYLLEGELCLVDSVSLAVYQAHWQPEQPVYAPRSARLLLGVAPGVVRNVVDMPVRKHTELQTLRLPYPVAATWMAIELLGRTQAQPYDDLWYTVLSEVRCHGWPLHTILHTVVGLALAQAFLPH
jgi:hypothetical protein